MLRNVRDRQPRPLSQSLDAAFPLSDQLEQLEPMLVRDRLGDDGKLRIEGALWIEGCLTSSYHSSELLNMEALLSTEPFVRLAVFGSIWPQ